MAKASAMRPGSGGGPIQNAKGQSSQRQGYGKGEAAKMHPAKKPGASGDSGKSKKASPFAGKSKK